MVCPACGSENVSFCPPDPVCICRDCATVWKATRADVLAVVCPTCGKKL
jgi:Zn finger protein HypA/HybF involved in hydrogenase expression